MILIFHQNVVLTTATFYRNCRIHIWPCNQRPEVWRVCCWIRPVAHRGGVWWGRGEHRVMSTRRLGTCSGTCHVSGGDLLTGRHRWGGLPDHFLVYLIIINDNMQQWLVGTLSSKSRHMKYVQVLSVTCRSVVSSGYSGFLHQLNWHVVTTHHHHFIALIWLWLLLRC